MIQVACRWNRLICRCPTSAQAHGTVASRGSELKWNASLNRLFIEQEGRRCRNIQYL
jgi:hypothetical protein